MDIVDKEGKSFLLKDENVNLKEREYFKESMDGKDYI